MKLNKRKCIILLMALLTGFAASCIFSEKSDIDDEKMQQELSGKLLRFHVIANSDSDEDQALKLKVKDGIIEYLKDYLNDTMSLEESKKIIYAHNDEIVALAKAIIKENGYDYEVTAELTKSYFPVKAYGDVTLPAGEYEAYRICIGENSGKNWWCILYPPLCFVDVSYGYVPEESKLLLSNILDDEEYQYITGGEQTIYRFKYLTFLNKLFE